MASQHTTLITGTKGSYTTTQETYYSQNITLKAGHMIFTDIDKTPLKMPLGEYAITHFIGDIVFADTHEPVPLSEVYCHHWTAVSSTHKNQLCHDRIEYTFGIGAESRNNVDFLPATAWWCGTKWGQHHLFG